MASNGEGKGRVASAEAEGGYGYGGYDGWHWQHFKWWPCLVPTIIIACVAVFAVEMNENNCPMHESRYGGCVAGFMRRFSFQPLRENPLLGPSSATLERMGALDWNKIVHQHQVWRLISSMWLHAGLIHLIVNMLSLTFIGMRLEQQIGLVHFGAIYIVSGFGGSVLSTLFLQNNYISIGASGALFGLLGSMLSELIMNWTIYTNKTAAISTLLFVIALNLAIGIFPHVDNFSHIGGFATGFLLGFVLLARPQFGWMERHELPQTSQPPKYKAYQYVLWVVALILLLVGFVISLVMLSMGKNWYDSCHWCHYLNCVPTSSWKCKT